MFEEMNTIQIRNDKRENEIKTKAEQGAFSIRFFAFSTSNFELQTPNIDTFFFN